MVQWKEDKPGQRRRRRVVETEVEGYKRVVVG